MSNSFMTKAIDLARENVKSLRGGPFAALVVLNDDIVSEGTNLVTSTNDPTAHAEIVAIREACRKLGHFQLEGCDIYSTGEPCPMCMAAIYWARPAHVYFAGSIADASEVGFDDAFIGEELVRPLRERRIPMTQIMREAARQVYMEWSQLAGKAEY